MTDIREKVARALIAQMQSDDPQIYVRDAEQLDTLGTVDGYVKFGNLADAALEASGYHRMREALADAAFVLDHIQGNENKDACRWEDGGAEKHCRGTCESMGCVKMKLTAARSALGEDKP